MEHETIAERVRRLRLARGLSQGALAAAAAVTPTHVHQIEKGLRQRMNEDTAERYAAALGVSVPYLLYGYEMVKEGDSPSVEVILRRNHGLLKDEDIRAIVRFVEGLELRQLAELARREEEERDGG